MDPDPHSCTNAELASSCASHTEDAISAPSRRAFLRTASASAVLAALGIPVAGCSDENPVGPDDDSDDDPDDGGGDSGITIDGSTITLDLTKSDTERLKQSGNFLLIGVADVLAVNVDGDTIRAFTSTCTHQQCTINQFSGSTFECPCHGSQFDTSGDVVQGPAAQSLTEYDVAREGDTVTITK